MADALQTLKNKHKIWQFRNRTSSAQTIMLHGDTVQVQPAATAKILSALFIQLPPFSIFSPIVPSVDELIEAGVIASSKEASPVRPAVITMESSTDSPDKQTGGKTSKSS